MLKHILTLPASPVECDAMRRASGQPACTQSSLEANEQLFGTAVESTELWVLIEVPGGWANKAPATKGLPPVVAETWETVTNTPHGRMQFIKQQPRESAERRIFIGNSGSTPWWVTWTLPSLEALRDLDIPAILGGSIPAEAETVEEPFYLVCTHGKRDACCAKYGMALYRAMHQHSADRVWQTSHIGGHRFAATMLAFPTGHCYGRLTPQDAVPLLDAYENRLLAPPDRLRGKTSHSRPAQAAAHFVRQQQQLWGLDDIVRIQTTTAVGQGVDVSEGMARWTVSVETSHSEYQVAVTSIEQGSVYGSCFKTMRQPSLAWQCSWAHQQGER